MALNGIYAVLLYLGVGDGIVLVLAVIAAQAHHARHAVVVEGGRQTVDGLRHVIPVEISHDVAVAIDKTREEEGEDAVYHAQVVGFHHRAARLAAESLDGDTVQRNVRIYARRIGGSRHDVGDAALLDGSVLGHQEGLSPTQEACLRIIQKLTHLLTFYFKRLT